jgi:mersacidin/lichenicidin family type 2 lantibiotic
MTRQASQRKEDVMRHLDIIRAWKDEEYRLSLSEAERALLPAHPAGLITLTDAELDSVGGGFIGPLLRAVFHYVVDKVQTAAEVTKAVIEAGVESVEIMQRDPAAHDAVLRSLS